MTKSRIALQPRISSLSPPAGLSGVRRVAAFLAHGTRVRSFHCHVLSFQQIHPRSGASAGSEVAEFMDATGIHDQIDRILRSQSFASKGQLRKLLEILLQNMDSQTTLTPNRVIKELWPVETRTKRSADVATEMNRLRHALESYYNGEGKSDPITVILPNRSVPGPDGMLEKRWIVAKPREGETAGSRRASEDQRPIPQVSARRSLKLAAAIAGIGIVGYAAIRVLAVHDQPKFGAAGRFDAYDYECGRKGALEKDLS